MSVFTQANRGLAITTPLGPDTLLLVGLQGSEAISQLFHFQLDLLAEHSAPVAFDRLIGQPVTVALTVPGGGTRWINGIINRFTQGKRDGMFTCYRAEVVPQFWLWTRRVQSRIFQHLAIPDILKQVLAGLSVTFEFQEIYYPRDYCVQYRESDFDFASRLMEEEGIYYFFRHTDKGHTLVVTDVADRHPDLPGESRVIYEELTGGRHDAPHVTGWEKTQELRSGKYTLRDHCFELPGKHLAAQRVIPDSVPVGQVSHQLRLAGNDKLEIYDYPGGYAQRFDGVDRSGGDREADLLKVFEDNQRTVRIRLEQETVPSLQIQGEGNCGHFSPGHQFTLERHPDGDGAYLLTRVEHEARLGGNYRSGADLILDYRNRFTCSPAALPYRPPQVTARPVIAGTQTATVVGPRGEEIFCDKYGRVKVQFHWDRHGKHDANSSCWIRVAQVWAGKGWGAFFWPRIGHEVVVAFEEGDPDRPIIVGSVYNAENMPPFRLPKENMLSGFKSCSVRGRARQHYNGIVFVDAKDREHLAIHSERHMSFNSEFDKIFHAGRHKGERVAGVSVLTVGNLPGGGGSGGGPDAPDAPVGGDGSQYQRIGERGSDDVAGTRHPVGEVGSLYQRIGERGSDDVAGTRHPVGEVGSLYQRIGDGSRSGPQLSVPPDVYGVNPGRDVPPDRSQTQGPFGHPRPQAVMGINLAMVYGENVQATVGVNQQLTVGSNVQVCINPAGLCAGVPGFPTDTIPSAVLGSGLGGNMQLTIGCSANIVLGRVFDINLGPPKIEVENGRTGHLASFIMFGVLGSLAALWSILHALFGEDRTRAVLAAAFQPVFGAGLAVLMKLELDIKKAEENYQDRWETLFATDQNTALKQDLFGTIPGDRLDDGWANLGYFLAAVGVGLIPFFGAVSEDTFDHN